MTNKEHFIATLQACYFGDRNSFNEIVRIYDDMEQRLKEVSEENQKLVKVIDELEKELKLNLPFRVVGVRRLLTLLTELKGGSDESA